MSNKWIVGRASFLPSDEQSLELWYTDGWRRSDCQPEILFDGMSDDDLERELAAPQKQFGVRCPYKCLGNEETFRDTNMKS